MNQLQQFMADANAQVRIGGPMDYASGNVSLIKEDFTIVGEVPQVSRLGTFGNPTVVPIMTRNGYQDHIVTFMECEKALFATPPASKGSLVRTQTGRTLFIQAVDTTHPVIYTFTLTDRSLP